MGLILLATAKSQVRITSTAEDTLLQIHLDAAEAHTQRFLNRNVYDDDAALAAAIADVPAALTAAQAAYDSAMDAWIAASQSDLAALGAWKKALRDYREAGYAADRVYGGIVINEQITHAILLLFGHYANNREAVITDSSSKALVLPLGYEPLLEMLRIDEGV